MILRATSTAVLALVALLAIVPPARANDAAMGGTGMDLVPERQTAVRMLEEDIVIAEVGEPSRWRIEARYVFENASDVPVELTMGFPERRCDPDVDGDCMGDGRFEQMQTFVRGVQVAERVGEVGRRTPWRIRLGRVFLFDVRFAARERVEARHVYRMVGNESVMGRGITYVTRTGGLWNGPIGSARFTLRLLSAPPILDVPREYVVASARHVDRASSGHGYEIVFAMRDWTPRRDLEITVFSLATALESAGCPWDGLVSRPTDSAETEELVQSYARQLDDETLRTCRNLPYARHGRPFRTRSLARLFYRRGFDVALLGRRHRYLEDPGFTESRLTLEDHRYVAFLARVAAARAALARP